MKRIWKILKWARRLCQRVLNPLPQLLRKGASSPSLKMRVLVTGLLLVAASGFVRHHLGLTPFLARTVAHVQDGWEDLLRHCFRVQFLATALTPLPTIFRVWMIPLSLIWYAKQVKSYVNSIQLLLTSKRNGIRLTEKQLSILLCLPLMCLYAILATGYDSLFGIANALVILVYLDRFLDEKRIRKSLEWGERGHAMSAGQSFDESPGGAVGDDR